MNAVKVITVDPNRHWRVVCGRASVEIEHEGYSALGDPVYLVGHGIRRYSWEEAHALACEIVSQP